MAEKHMLFLSVVIPTYNSANWILDFLHEIDIYLKENYYKYEIIVVDDCSSDDTKDSLRSVENENIHIHVNNNREGQHFTTWFGIKKATGDIVVTIDDDREYLPDQIEKLLQEQINSNCDVIYGIPNTLKKGGLKILLYKLYLANLKRTNESRKSSFRLITRGFLNKCSFDICNIVNIDKYFETLNVKNSFIYVNYSAGDKGRYSLIDYLKAFFIAATYKP